MVSGAQHHVDVSPEPSCLRDQKHPRPDDDGSDGSRDALTGRCSCISTAASARPSGKAAIPNTVHTKK